MKMKRVLAICLILVLSISCAAPVCAADADIQGSSQIAVTVAQAGWLDEAKGRMAVVYSIVTAMDMEKIGVEKIEFYHYLYGKWGLEHTIYATDFPIMFGSDTSAWQGSAKYSTEYLNIPYYAIVYFYAKGPYGISTGQQRTNVI